MIYQRITQRQIEEAFATWRAVLIFGSRQIGKTTMAEHYFSQIKTKKLKILGQERSAQEILGSLDLGKIKTLIQDNEFLFIDEAQYIPDIGTVLKLIYDALPQVKVLATGSSAFGLASKTHESMAGRKLSLKTFPLSIKEVVNNRLSENVFSDLESFLLYGFYPKVLDTKLVKEKIQILTEIADAFLYKDVLEFQGIRKPAIIVRLVKSLALQIGNQVSLSELAKSLEVSKETVGHYIDILIKSYIIFPVSSYSKNPHTELHKSMKYYFYDLGIRNAVLGNFNQLTSRTDVGFMWENFVISELYKKYTYIGEPFTIYHWRTYDQKEIDILVEANGVLIAFECKYSDVSAKYSNAIAFNKVYPDTEVKVIHKHNFGEILI